MKSVWLLLLLALLVSAVCLPIVYIHYQIEKEASNENFFFGVSYGSNTTSEAKLLIDKVKGYTNLFVINSWDITTNETALNEICEYAIGAKLNVIVYFDFVLYAGNLFVVPHVAGYCKGKVGKQLPGHLPLR